ncbi:MAG: SDR family oxidoreductase [Candidatus Eisenbacteria bacterium]
MKREGHSNTPDRPAFLETGQRYEFRETISEDLVDSFVRFSGDDNPLHTDRPTARRLGFPTRVAHGAILYSFVSRAIGTHLPGPGSLWFSADFEFNAPVHIGDSVTVRLEVEHFSPGLEIAVIGVDVENDRGETVLTGTAKVRILEEAMPRNFIPIKDQTVLVTGGTRGLGRTITASLLETGARVVATYVADKEAAKETAAASRDAGTRLRTVRCDIAASSDLDGLFEAVRGFSDGLTAFVHCASPPLADISFRDLGWEACDKFLTTYVKSAIEIIQRSLPDFERSAAGRVVLIGSEAVQAPKKNWTHYIVGKAALNGLRNALSLELGEIGTSVNTISPGLIHTSNIHAQNIKMMVKNATPLKKLVSEEEIADTVLFLLERGGSFISGANIPMSGGRILYS